MDKLLNKAELRYKKGTKVKSLGTGLIGVSSGVAFRNYVNDIYVKYYGSDSKIGVIRVYSEMYNMWANIL